MGRTVDRQTDALIEQYVRGQLTRRGFVRGLLGLGLSIPTAGAVLAACSARTTSTTSTSTSGTVRFLIGPWTDQEVAHQKVVAAAYKSINPKVSFSFQLFDWSTATTQVDTSLAQNAHDIYYFGEGDYVARSQQKDGFADLASRVNDPAWAKRKDKYLYWDRIDSYGPKIMGLPVCSHFEDALFVNMDMVHAAGFDETFVDDWDTFVACVTKMTKGRDVYGLGIGMQLGGFGEWYQRARSAGGSYLTPDLKRVAINTPDVVEATQQMVDFFKHGIAPPQGTFDYNTAPDAFIGGRMAIYSSDLTIAAVLKSKPKPPAFEWAVLPYPPGSHARLSFDDLGFYAMSTHIDPDLGWDVLQWWTGGKEAAYWADVSGTYPSRRDAIANGYGKLGAKQLADAFNDLQKHGVGCEPFAAWGTVETQAEAQVARAYGGDISAPDAVSNVEKIVNHEVFKK